MKHQTRILFGLAAALLVAPAFASPVRNQTLASPDAVPEGLSAPDWSSIRQQYEQHRHAAFPANGGYQTRNPGQQWQTRFDGRGFTTKPDGAAWQWGLELQSYGFPGHERAVAGQPRVTTAGQRVTYDWDATLQEWFVNDRHGLEHGFTVNQRPTRDEPRSSRREEAHSKESAILNPKTEIDQSLLTSPATGEEPTPLTFTLAVRGGLRPEVQADGRGVRFVDEQGTAALTYSELTVFDADGRKLPARFEAVSGGANVLASRAGLVETRLVSSLAPPEIPEDVAPCLRLVIDERGARYPLTIDPIAQQAYLKASNTDEFDGFGVSVAVSGNTVVVGAWGEASNATGVNGDQSDDTAEAAGAAYIFVRNGTTWSQQAYLKASNTDSGDYFGRSAAISGDTVVVGAYGEDSSATGVDGDGSDNSILFAGAAYVFVRNGTNWNQQAYLKASNTGGDLFSADGYNGDHFGGSVAVAGNTVVVGAYGESSSARGVNGNQSNNLALASGAAYVFVRSGTTWTQQAYLKASNTGAYDFFGQSVTVSGDTVVVGAVHESSNAIGVNGNQSNNSAVESGAAYIFTGLGIGPHLALAPDGSGGYFLRFTGAPDVTYRLQRAPSLTGPWSARVTNTAPASGLIEYHETSPPPGAAFYRTAQP